MFVGVRDDVKDDVSDTGELLELYRLEQIGIVEVADAGLRILE